MRAFRAILAVGLVLAGCSGAGPAGPGPVGATMPVASSAGTTSSGDERPEGEPLAKIENPTLADILAPGPLPERILGRADAPVALIEYVSLTCPYCRAFHETVLADIKKQYIDKGRSTRGKEQHNDMPVPIVLAKPKKN